MLTISDICKSTKGRFINKEKNVSLRGISINTRTMKKGDIFIAIKGDRFDGHDFIDQAIKKGASALVVSKKISKTKHPVILCVADTTKALGQIASLHRQQFNIPIIAITGSAGKTTTKELVAAVLKSKYKVLKNVKTENNHIGVPLTLLRLQPSHQVVVLELGTNTPGDIVWLSKIVEPTVALFTNIGESHLLGLKSVSGVFREKFQLVKYMDSKGTIIFNRDNKYLGKIEGIKTTQKKVSYAVNSKALFHAENINRRRQTVSFSIKGKKYVLHTLARHNVSNALAAICCGSLFKIEYNEASAAIKRFRFSDQRQAVKKIKNIYLIDDTYNSNPVSLRSAIETLEGLKTRGKRILVCADMLELGQSAKRLHQEIGCRVGGSLIEQTITFGSLSKYITQEIKKFDSTRAVHCRDLADVHKQLEKFCCSGDAVLVKGSRGMRMESVVQFLEKLGNKL